MHRSLPSTYPKGFGREAVDELLRSLKPRTGDTETRSRKIRIGTKLILRESVADKQVQTERQGIQ